MLRRAPLLAAAALAAGCGNPRTEAPDVVTPGPPLGTVATSYPAQGLTFSAPGGWHVQPGTAPLVATVQTGRATIAIWRYPRSEPLPAKKQALDQARDLLLAAAKAREPTFKEVKVAITKIDGHPAVQIRGTEKVSGAPRMVRSTHVYAFGAEVVVDALAPAGVFRRVDRESFSPMLRSLKLFQGQ